jgi:hypothetical protein
LPWTSCGSQRSARRGGSPGILWQRSAAVVAVRAARRPEQRQAARSKTSYGPCGQIWARAGKIWAWQAQEGACGRGCWSSAGHRSGGSGPWCLRPAVLGGFLTRASVDSKPLATDLARGAAVMSAVGRLGISPDLGSSSSSSVALVPGGDIFG